MKYRFFNKVIHTNAAIEGLPLLHDNIRHDLDVVFMESSLPTASLELLHQGPEHAIYGGSRWLRQCLQSGVYYYSSIHQPIKQIEYTFKFHPDRPQLDVLYGPPTTLELCLPTLIQGALPMLLRMWHGLLCLHAGVLMLEERNFGVIGPSGSGKSTLLLTALQDGAALLSEDVAVIERVANKYMTYPGIARVRVFPDTLRRIGGDTMSAHPLYPEQTDEPDVKQYVDASQHPYWDDPQPRPLEAIFVLRRREVDLKAPKIELIEKRDAVITLLQNRFGNLPVEADRQKREIRQISELVRQVPVYLLRRPDGFFHLPSTLDAIREQLLELAT